MTDICLLSIPCCVFNVGDLVVVPDADGFSMLGISRPQYRSTPRCWVHGIVLLESDIPFCYHGLSKDEAKFQYGSLKLLKEHGAVILVGRDAVDVALIGEAITITLSEQLSDRILAALDEGEESAPE